MIGPPLPIWVAVELWEFGMLSRFYQGMCVGDQDAIARRYAVSDGRLLQSWLRTLNYVRNVAAHHSRLWNRNLVDQPRLPRDDSMPDFVSLRDQPAIQSRLFIVLCILLHLLEHLYPNSTWPARLLMQLREFLDVPRSSVADMGFPMSWTSNPLWRRAAQHRITRT